MSSGGLEAVVKGGQSVVLAGRLGLGGDADGGLEIWRRKALVVLLVCVVFVPV